MLPRLEAEEALLSAQISLLPSLTEDKQRTVIERWENAARADPLARFDRRGRRIVEHYEEFNAFLAQFGVA